VLIALLRKSILPGCKFCKKKLFTIYSQPIAFSGQRDIPKRGDSQTTSGNFDERIS
jgi:hypothetical protein